MNDPTRCRICGEPPQKDIPPEQGLKRIKSQRNWRRRRSSEGYSTRTRIETWIVKKRWMPKSPQKDIPPEQGLKPAGELADGKAIKILRRIFHQNKD